MSGRLGEVAAHLHTSHELGVVIAAMRGIAAARSREARQQLDGVRAYATTLGTAIGEALALLPEPDRPTAAHNGGRRRLVLALCAEQGFAGSFNERVLEVATQRLDAAGAQLLVVGERGVMGAAERGQKLAWSVPMAVHTDEMSALAARIADALYARLADGTPTRVTLVHALPGGSGRQQVVARPLLPFDYSRFPVAQHGKPPLITLAPGQLIAGLAEEYVYAELCEALMLSFAAENEARMQAMIAAQGNVEQRRTELLAEFRRVRQNEITDEIIELSSSRL
jgi:F-type H+-transporting ATPase subunit gamma